MRFRRMLPLLALPGILAGCGYHRLDQRPHRAAWLAKGDTVRIASFQNSTSRLGIEETFRKALEHRVVAASPWKLVGQNASSRWVLQASLDSYSVSAIGLNLGTASVKGSAGSATRVEVTMQGSMQLLDGQTGALLLSRPSLTFSKQYAVGQNFASFDNRELEVLDTLADDFAESFLTQFLEGSD
jgi:hypothetical protein